MGFRKEVYIKSLEKVNQSRIRAERSAEQCKNKAYTTLPRLSEIDRNLSELGARIAISAIAGDSINTLRAECDSLSEEKRKLLSDNGYSPSDFIPKYDCESCNDTGYANGKLCRCVKTIAKQLMYSELSSSMPLDDSRFDNFDLSFYPDENEGISPRKRIKQIYDMCVDYVNNFSCESQNLLFLGKTGLGKTHLSLAIARAVIDKGYGVIYGPAQDILCKVEREHFGKDNSGDTLENILTCDLLILDDLGTEFSSPFYVSVINNIVNTRLLTKKPTIINTNLNPAELEERYTARVISRLIGNYTMKQFLGKDVREQKRLRNLK